jgi:hypothetical protein
MFGIFIDATGRKQAEEGNELLAGEMRHGSYIRADSHHIPFDLSSQKRGTYKQLIDRSIFREPLGALII